MWIGAATAAGVWAAPVAAAEDGVECDGRFDVYGGLDGVFGGVADGAVGFVAIVAVGFGADAVGVEFLGEVAGVAVGAFGLSFGRGV